MIVTLVVVVVMVGMVGVVVDVAGIVTAEQAAPAMVRAQVRVHKGRQEQQGQDRAAERAAQDHVRHRAQDFRAYLAA